MAYDAVSAYTVLLGDGDGPTTVSVHGSAVDAWAALAAALGQASVPVCGDGAGTPGLPVPRPGAAVAAVPEAGVSEDAIRAAAEAWREADPTRRFWQVSAHRLQVQVPAINTGPIVSRSA